ncbi:MAG: alpha-amylase [Candidatus Omnitrophica bacterium]|nr:alpha-amylase [Candidatus Omnitrophota bacterium]MBU1047782.1 alpha-amylase [Candidatus Omnitrophota bacterium]MBU1631050.1 alpha-amylase [Candidatus Omnitrophota bacterium]MBU1766843.1 alpha-amylase [Candidatus Omnitrophota bacterium]MBU1889317.1 alpha-amylase [Candidatus Omnitrophota bacterium]
MAKDTIKELRNKIIYEVYVRNHGKTGTFKDVSKDLNRIKELGVDIIWFMPIHPIGKVNRKGNLGCPYSISDYAKVNPEYGTENEFKKLIEEIHNHDMKVMIDVVYNHTSYDSIYRDNHPEFFYKTLEGNFGNKVNEWLDVIDLDYSNTDLWKEQIKTLKKWVKMGIDGFRCDVASLVPVEFWVEARKQIKEVNPDIILLAETVHPKFLKRLKDCGFYAASDCEVYKAFDITYDYDTHDEFLDYFNGAGSLDKLLERKRIQEYIYPENYVKLRFLENHDNPRAKSIIPNDELLNVWTGFFFFEKGSVLLYAGQEAKDSNAPSLFDVDKVNWENLSGDYVELIKKLSIIKKEKIFAYGNYRIHKPNVNGVIYATYTYENKIMIGVFNVESKVGELDLTAEPIEKPGVLKIKDGRYVNEIDGYAFEVNNNKVKLISKPIIFSVENK